MQNDVYVQQPRLHLIMFDFPLCYAVYLVADIACDYINAILPFHWTSNSSFSPASAVCGVLN